MNNKHEPLAAPAAIEQAGARPAESGIVGWQNRMAPDQIVEGKNPPNASDKWVAVVYAEQAGAQPVAEVDEGEEGLFIDFIYGPDGSPLKRGDKLYLAAPTPATDQRDFERGYFCAVSTALYEDGDTALVRSLFRQGGDPTKADPLDIERFIEHGLLAATPVTDQPKQGDA
jgi:hypothetical protein